MVRGRYRIPVGSAKGHVGDDGGSGLPGPPFHVFLSLFHEAPRGIGVVPAL